MPSVSKTVTVPSFLQNVNIPDTSKITTMGRVPPELIMITIGDH